MGGGFHPLTSIVFRAGQIEIGHQVERLGVGNVDAVQKGQKVHDDDERHQAHVDAPDHVALRGVRRAHDAELVVDQVSDVLGIVVAGDVGWRDVSTWHVKRVRV